MTNDEIMQSLARLAQDDERWLRLSDGSLPAAERERLASRAAKDPELGRAYEAYRPLSDEIRGRIVERARLSIGHRKASATTSAAEEEGQAPQSRWFRQQRWALPAIGALAATLLLVLWPRATLAPLPGFALEHSGGISVERSIVVTASTYHPDSEIKLLLRPETAIEGELEAALFADLGGGLERLAIEPTRISEAGNVLFAADRFADLFPGVASGSVEVWLVAGRTGSLPDAATLAALDTTTASGADWSAQSARLPFAEVP